MDIDFPLKQRLVGIAVIVSLAVIFLPMLLDGAGMIEKQSYKQIDIQVPPAPIIERRLVDFSAKEKELKQRLEKIPQQNIRIVDQKNKTRDLNEVATQPKKIDASEKKPAVAKKVGGDSWSVQIGSFKSQEKAFKLQKTIRSYKIAAVFIQKVVLNNSKSYRVRMGPFLNQKQAKAAVQKLEKKYNIKAVVMKHSQ